MSSSEASPFDRHIWDLDCAAISVLLAHALPIDTLRKVTEDSVCDCCAHLVDDDAWVLQGAHRACHHPNAISRTLEDHLNCRYAGEILAVRAASLPTVARQVANPARRRNAVGLTWALLTDANRKKRRLGARMVHALILQGARREDATAADAPVAFHHAPGSMN